MHEILFEISFNYLCHLVYIIYAAVKFHGLSKSFLITCNFFLLLF